MKNYKKIKRQEKIIQFGEGGFLRGFVDWILQEMNEKTDFNGSAVVVQPIENGMCDRLSEQNCVYTHIMRGLENGEAVSKSKIIDVLSRCGTYPYLLKRRILSDSGHPSFSSSLYAFCTVFGLTVSSSDSSLTDGSCSFSARALKILYLSILKCYKNYRLIWSMSKCTKLITMCSICYYCISCWMSCI